MSRRADPDRIYLARRAAQFRRLVDDQHIEELDAEHWIRAWEREAESRGVDRLAGSFLREGEQVDRDTCRLGGRRRVPSLLGR
jgi:hypothetical protein